MYILLTGAKKNIGDFLIEDHAKKLFKFIKKDEQIELLPRWVSPDEIHLSKVNQSKGVVLAGGPFFKKNVPFDNKFFDRLNEIQAPIYFLAGGWKGQLGDEWDLENDAFNPNSIKFMKKISEKYPISCRDQLTEKFLNKNGIQNTQTTGCVVWYEPSFLGKSFKKIEKVKTIVFTPAQLPNLHHQSYLVAKKLRQMFPDAKIVASLNRGLSADQFTSKKEANSLKKLTERLNGLNIESLDTSYDLSKIEFYKDSDLHIGYRVHTHVKFLSERRPSYLIYEDSRGKGMDLSLGVNGVHGFKRNKFFTKLTKLLKSKTLKDKLYPFRVNANDSEVLNFMDSQVNKDAQIQFKNFDAVATKIDSTFDKMKKFINEL